MHVLPKYSLVNPTNHYYCQLKSGRESPHSNWSAVESIPS